MINKYSAKPATDDFKTKDAIKFLVVCGVLVWFMFAGANKLNYNWQWYRIPKFLFTVVDGSFVSGPLLKGLWVTLKITAAKKYMPKARLRLFDDESEAYQELVNGRVHAVVASAPTPAFQALKYPAKLFLPLDKTFTREPIGFAVKKGDFDSMNYLDNWIRYVKAEGFLKDRKHYWFRTKNWEKRIK